MCIIFSVWQVRVSCTASYLPNGAYGLWWFSPKNIGGRLTFYFFSIAAKKDWNIEFLERGIRTMKSYELALFLKKKSKKR